MERLGKELKDWGNWGYWVMVGMGIAAFLVPMFGSPTESDPTSSAGVFAPIIALSVGGIIFSEAAFSDSQKFRTRPSYFIGLGSMAAAYMWMADAAGTHPRDPVLTVPVLMLFGIAAAFVTLAFVLRQGIKS